MDGNPGGVAVAKLASCSLMAPHCTISQLVWVKSSTPLGILGAAPPGPGGAIKLRVAIIVLTVLSSDRVK
jgi:hypothetical protein